MMGLNVKAQTLQGTFNRVKLAAIGAGVAIAGGAVLAGMGKMVEHGEKLVHQQALLRQQLPGADIAAATANAWRTAGAVLGSNVTDNLQLTKELIGVLGTLKDAQNALPEVAKASLVLSTITGRDSDKSMQNLMKALEQRGGVVNPDTGHIDPRTFTTELNAALKMMVASGGLISTNDMSNVMKQAGPMARMMSPDTFYKTMMTVIMEMGGARAGTALTAFGRVAYGGIMPERNAKEMERLHLFGDGKYHVGRGGHVMVDQNALKGMDILNTKGLDAWFNQVMKPAMEKAGYTTAPQQMQELYRLLPTETARRLAGLFLQQHETVQRDVGLYDQANGLAAYGDLSKTDPTLRMTAFKEAWDNLMTALGEPMVETAYKMLDLLTWALNGLGQWAATHRDLVQVMEGVTAAFAGLALVGGGLAVIAAGISAVSGGLLLLGGPVGAVVLLGGAAIYAVTHIEELKSALQTLFGWVKDIVPDILRDHGIRPPTVQGSVPSADGLLPHGPNAPNGIPQIGPRFGPQHPGDPSQAPGFQRQSYVPPPASQSDLVHVIMYVDGQKMTDMVTKRQARAATRAPSGTSAFDTRMSAFPVGRAIAT